MKTFDFPTNGVSGELNKGFDLRVNDIKHLYDGLLELIEAFGSILPENDSSVALRLSGAKFVITNDGGYELSGGWIFYNNEIFRVEASTISGVEPALFIQEVSTADEPHTTYDSNGSSGTLDIKKIRTIKAIDPTNASGMEKVADWDSLEDIKVNFAYPTFNLSLGSEDFLLYLPFAYKILEVTAINCNNIEYSFDNINFTSLNVGVAVNIDVDNSNKAVYLKAQKVNQLAPSAFTLKIVKY